MSLRKWQAKSVLASLFFLHLIGRILFFWRKKKGLPTFLANFASDGIGAVPTEERLQLSHFSKCLNCSLCAFSCTAISEGRAPAQFEPKMLLLGFGRSAHEAEHAIDEWVPCLECPSCSVLCPNEVPVHEMAERIRDRRMRLKFRS